MRTLLIFSFFFALHGQYFAQPQKFDKGTFYSVIAGKNLSDIETQLTVLNTSSFGDKKAFEGALQMKKAGLLQGTPAKIDLFKTGHRGLEESIKKDSNHVEYRFLRLMIQENSPKILNYHHDLQKDASYLRKHYKQLDPVVKQALLKYSKSSKILKPEDLSNPHD
jgi:hypothetical protein